MARNIGTVIQVVGPVLDIRFQDGCLPDLLNAIESGPAEQVFVLLMQLVVVRLHFAVVQKLLKTKKQVVSRLLLLNFHIR